MHTSFVCTMISSVRGIIGKEQRATQWALRKDAAIVIVVPNGPLGRLLRAGCGEPSRNSLIDDDRLRGNDRVDRVVGLAKEFLIGRCQSGHGSQRW